MLAIASSALVLAPYNIFVQDMFAIIITPLLLPNCLQSYFCLFIRTRKANLTASFTEPWSYFPRIKAYQLISTYLNCRKVAFVLYFIQLAKLISSNFNISIVIHILYTPSTLHVYILCAVALSIQLWH